MRLALLLAILATAALAVFGAGTTAGFFAGGLARWVGVPAVLTILAAYGLATAVGVPATQRRAPQVLAIAAPLGLAGGAVYAAEILAEYALRPTDNTAWGLAEFGAVFGLFLVAGGVSAWRTGRLGAAALAGLWTAVISALCWYAVALAVFYAFRGTDAQAAVLRAEGDYEDFRASGMTDFRVFMMQDFLGAGFFHLLLSPLFGALLGGIGAAPGLLARRIQARPA
ncbi:MAG: hypothetical protein ACXWK7_19735 [Caulobacteraceae bacterium]